MVTNVALGSVSLLLALLVLLQIRRNLGRLSLADIYVGSVGLYLFAYTAVDALVNDLSHFEPDTAILTLTMIGLTLMVFVITYPALPGRLRRLLELKTLYTSWVAVPARPLLIVVSILVAYRLYTSMVLGYSLALSDEDLRAIDSSAPYWYTSLSPLIPELTFCVMLASSIKFFRSAGKSRLFWLAIMVASEIVLVEYGRRALLSGLIAISLAWFLRLERGKLGWGRGIVWACLLALALLMISNLFQAERTSVYRGVYLKDMQSTDQEDRQSVIDKTINSDNTLQNLRRRAAMWQLNYALLDAYISDGTPQLQWGALFTGEIANIVPRFLIPNKTAFDGDGAISAAFRIQDTDWPSNLFAFAFGDFGFLAIVLVPLFLCMVLWVTARLLYAMEDPFSRLIISGFVMNHLLNVEAAYTTAVVVFRDIFVVLAIYYAVSFVAHITRPSRLRY